MASRKVSYLVNQVIRWQASNEIIVSGHSTHDLFHEEEYAGIREKVPER